MHISLLPDDSVQINALLGSSLRYGVNVAAALEQGDSLMGTVEVLGASQGLTVSGATYTGGVISFRLAVGRLGAGGFSLRYATAQGDTHVQPVRVIADPA